MPEPNEPPTEGLPRGVVAGILVVTAVLLLWVGWVLPADAADAMDGFQRLVFTVIPVRPFAWVMAVVFLALAGRLLLKGGPSE